jgi:uncharacterized protein (DUF1778 family)
MEKRGRGRPTAEERRETVRNVRFTEEEDAEVEAAAKSDGRPVATWIREAALEAARTNSDIP